MPIKMLSPTGRIVQGNPLFKSPVMDDVTKQQKIGKDGQPSFNWWITVAFDKKDPAVWPMICAIKQEAAAAYPQLFPQGWNPNAANEGCVRPDFAFKVVDGDGMDLNGKPHSNKEGWGGHYILKISTYAGTMKCYDGLQNNLPITDMEQIHTGKFVRVSLDIKGNGWTGQGNSKPGLFINPDGVQLVGHGAKISGGPDAETMFAAPVSTYVPAGMSTTAPVAAIAMPGQAAPQMQMPGQPAPQMTPAPQMQAPAPQMVTPQAPVYTMTALAQGHTREAWHASGQTDESLIAAGYMTVSTPAPAPQMVALQAAPALQMPAPGIMGQQPQMQAPIVQPTPAPQAAPVMQIAQPNPAFTQSAIAPTYTMTALAQGFTREQWLASGQTDQALIAAGMMQVA